MLESVPFLSGLRQGLARGGALRRLVGVWLLLAASEALWIWAPSSSYLRLVVPLSDYSLRIDFHLLYVPTLLLGLLFGFGWGASLAYLATLLIYVHQGYSWAQALFVGLADPIDLFLLYYSVRILNLKLSWRQPRMLPSLLFLSLFSSLAGSLQALAGSFLFDSLAVRNHTALDFWEGWLTGSLLQKLVLVLPLAAYLLPKVADFKASCRAGLKTGPPMPQRRLVRNAAYSLVGFGLLFAYTSYQIVHYVFEPLQRAIADPLADSLIKAATFFVVLSGLGVIGILWVLGKHFLGETLDRQRQHQELEREREQFWRYLVRSEKMSAIGTLAGGVAHEFNNILQGIMTAVDLALRTDRQGAVQFALQTAQQSCERASKLTRSLLSFSRRSDGPRQPVDLGELVRECGTLLERVFKKSGIEVSLELAPAPAVLADRGALALTLLSLITNARTAVEARQPPRRIQIRLASANGSVRLEIEDNGRGMSEEELGRIFEPFYSGHGTGQGLGLVTVYSVIRDHGGQVDVRSKLGAGSTFTVTLPVA